MTALDDPPTFAAPGVSRPDVPRETDGTDGDLDLAAHRDELDPLAALAEIAEPIEMPDAIVPHRLRPGWAVRYSTVVDLDDVKRWRKRAKAPGKKDELDEIRFACIVLANLCQALLRNNLEVTGPDGPLTFASPQVWQTYNATRAADAVRAFYGNDPYLVATLDAVLAAAGVGEEVEALDPTRPSSD